MSVRKLTTREFNKYNKQYNEDLQHTTCPTCNHKQVVWDGEDADWDGVRYYVSYYCEECDTHFTLYYKLHSVEVEDERVDTGGES